MLKCLRSSLLILLLIIFQSNDFIRGKVNGDSIKSLPETISDWQLKGKPEIYKGDDLFLYINGGADIYHEYGFEEVTSYEYEKAGAGRINVEIYRMRDPESAFGIFTFRTGGKWNKTPDGNLYSSEEYYLNILLGKNLVTITSIDINKKTGKGIEVIRDKLESGMSSPAFYPEIIRNIDPEKYKSRLYFKGDLGMMNIYNLFSAESGILHGSSGTDNDSIIFVLEFSKGAETGKRFDHLVTLFRAERRYSDFTINEQGTSFADRDKRLLLLSVIKGYIIINIEKTLTSCVDSAKNFHNYISADK